MDGWAARSGIALVYQTQTYYSLSIIAQYANRRVITLAASSEKHCDGLASVRLSVCAVGMLTSSHKAAACDAASVHFGGATRYFHNGPLLRAFKHKFKFRVA